VLEVLVHRVEVLFRQVLVLVVREGVVAGLLADRRTRLFAWGGVRADFGVSVRERRQVVVRLVKDVIVKDHVAQ